MIKNRYVLLILLMAYTANAQDFKFGKITKEEL